MMHVCSICAARPNFVKLAAVHHAMKERDDITHTIVHTGQHYDPLFSDVFFTQLDIPLPSYNLGIHGGTREEVIARTQESFAAILPEINPDIVLVYGDVNGAVGAAQATHEAGIRLGHVEAGLRSFDNDMPEEHNRIAIDTISNLSLCSEQSGIDNLTKEGIGGDVHLVGNTMIATLIRMMPMIESQQHPDVPERYAVVTLHRPSNVDTKEALENNLQFLGEVAKHTSLIMPLHHRTKASLEKFSLSVPDGITTIEPQSYIAFLGLLRDAEFILTDSGGIQEEAVYLQKRCFTLRKNTERPSTIASGSNVLIDIEKGEDRNAVLEFAQEAPLVTVTIPEKWDADVGGRIVAALRA